MMDTNIDTSNSGHNKSWNVENLKIVLFDFLNSSNVFVHNQNLTHFSKIHHDSCIDHIFSNCAQKLSPVITERNSFSDHATLHCTYSSSSQIIHPKFIFIRNNHLLTKSSLTNHIVNCTQLNDIFQSVDPNLIANEILLCFNTIIQKVAPLKKVHFKKNYVKYHDQKIRDDLKHQKLLLNNAISSNDQEDWRVYKNFKICLKKQIKIKKRE